MTANPPRFNSIDWVRVPGRGDFAVVLCDQNRPDGGAFLIGKTVDIDGAQYVVRSIEVPHLNVSMRKNEQFALWVQPHFEAQMPNTNEAGGA